MPQGRLLMGVLDEVGVLQPNEVYICCSPQRLFSISFFSCQFLLIFASEDTEPLYIEGDVVVTKNPCLHPGGIIDIMNIFSLFFFNFKEISEP